jgi:hypothetical protein
MIAGTFVEYNDFDPTVVDVRWYDYTPLEWYVRLLPGADSPDGQPFR